MLVIVPILANVRILLLGSATLHVVVDAEQHLLLLASGPKDIAIRHVDANVL